MVVDGGRSWREARAGAEKVVAGGFFMASHGSSSTAFPEVRESYALLPLEPPG